MRFFLLALFFLFSYSAKSQELLRVDLTGHPKVKGLAIAVKHPSDWISKEGERPNIVKKFVKSYPDSIAMMSLQIMSMPAEARAEMKSFTVRDWKEILTEVGSVLSVSKTKLEMEDAYIGDVSMKMERMGIAPLQRHRIVSLYYKDKWIWLWCGVVGNPNMSATQVEARFQSIQPQCHQFFNGFVLLDRYMR
jgi:hypothetical protein